MWSRRTCAVVAGGAMMCSIVVAQATAPPTQGSSDLDSPSEAVQHLASTYAALAPFDHDGDGEFDATERVDLLRTLEEGTWQPVPFRTRPWGFAPPREVLLSRIAWVYAMTRPFDGDRDETLDAQEQHALEAVLPCGDGSRRRPNAGCAGAPRWHGQANGGPPWR